MTNLRRCQTLDDDTNLSFVICHLSLSFPMLLLPFFCRMCESRHQRRRPMKKIVVLLVCVCALLGSVHPAEAGGLSWGIPLPFPFLFWKPSCGNSNQNTQNGYTKENGYSKDNGYSYTTASGYPARRNCPCIPSWLQYHVEYDCNMHLDQTTSMPGVGGLRDP